MLMQGHEHMTNVKVLERSLVQIFLSA